MAGVTHRATPDWGKVAFFAFLAAATVLVILADERFLVAPKDPEWAHIKAFQWWLLPHGLVGTVALLCGPFQFSDQLRTERPAIHRAIGWTFVVSGAITAALGWYISLNFGSPILFVEEYFHGGLILLSLAMAVVCIRNRNMQAHKIWMMRAYLVLLIFIWARLPDAFHFKMSVQVLDDVLWTGDVLGVLAPDLVLTTRDLMRRRRRKPAGPVAATA